MFSALETENSEFKVSLRGTFLFEVDQVLLDLLQIQLRRKTIEMQRQMRNATHVVVQRAHALSADNNLFLEALVKGFESRYLSRRALNQGSSLFFHDVHSCKSLLDRYNLL